MTCSCFGADTRLVRGRAFSLINENAALDEIPVGKQFVRIDGRPILIESAEFRALKPLFKDLRQAALPKRTKDRIKVAGTRSQALAFGNAAGPFEGGEVRMAMAQLPSRGVVIDYTTVSGSTPYYTFTSGTTYYLQAGFDVTTLATLQPGAILKFALNANLRIYGGLTCPTIGQVQPVFTSKDDNLFGESILGSTGSPTYMGQPAIALYYTTYGLTVQNIKFRWAKTGVEAIGSNSIQHTVRDSLFQKNQIGVKNSQSVGSIILNAVTECSVTTPTSGPNITGSMTTDCGPLYSVANFAGINYNEDIVNPPDTMGAVGPNHFVEVLNGKIAIYNKYSSQRIILETLETFFAISVTLTNYPAAAADPVIV